MGESAELGALTGIDAGLGTLEAQEVNATGDSVLLAVQFRDPVRVDDVAAGDAQQNFGVLGDDQLTGGHDGFTDAIHIRVVAHGRIVVLPPPLLTGDIDGHLGVAGLGQIEDGSHRRHTDTDEDQDRDDGEGDFESGLSVSLLGQSLSAIAVTEDHPRHRREDDDTHDAGDVEHWTLKIVDLLGVRAGGLPRVLGGILGATGQERQGGHGQRRLDGGRPTTR